MNSLIAIIVTHNGSKYIEHCLNSLQSSDRPPDRILVIDNASQDDTVRIVNSSFPSVNLIELEENIGFGAGNNIGLRSALNEGFDYVLLLNQDTTLKKDTIDRLMSVHEQHPEFGVISPIHIYDDERLDVNFKRYMGSIDPSFFSDILVGKGMKDIYTIDFVNAAIWFISSSCIRTIGGFDPLFEHTGEDDDFVHRMRHHGFKLGVCPKTFAYHSRDQNDRSWSSFREFIYSRDLINLKRLDRSLLKKVLKLNFISLKRVLYYAKTMQWRNLFISIKNWMHIIRKIPTIRKHCNDNVEHSSFLGVN